MKVEAVAVLVTGPTVDEMRAMASSVVAERLAACVNLIDGITSVYRWEGAVKSDREALAIMKTTRERLPALRSRVLELHPYEVPEFIAVPVVDGSAEYLDWLTMSVDAGSNE